MPSAPKRHVCVIPGATSRSINEGPYVPLNYWFTPAVPTLTYHFLPYTPYQFSSGVIDFSVVSDLIYQHNSANVDDYPDA
jgi:hypothetical protein